MSKRKPKTEVDEFRLPTKGPLSKLVAVLQNNPEIDWRRFSFKDSEQLKRIQWPTTSGKQSQQTQLMGLLKGYQRLLRILPVGDENLAVGLLDSNIHSAVQIARMSKVVFRRKWIALFPQRADLADIVHRNSCNRRTVLLLRYMNNLQRNEPHYRASRVQ